MQTTLKTLDAEAGRVGGYLVVWGSHDRRDLQGEFFTPETELGLDWYDKRPVLYHHGLDGDLKAAVIGTIDTLVADETGVWAEAQLDLRQRYVRAVQKLVDKGVLGDPSRLRQNPPQSAAWRLNLRQKPNVLYKYNIYMPVIRFCAKTILTVLVYAQKCVQQLPQGRSGKVRRQ